MLDGIDATNTAFEAGHESVSHFNRVQPSLSGQPPMRDVKALRLPHPAPCMLPGADSVEAYLTMLPLTTLAWW